MVEFAVLVPVLLLMVFGILDFGRGLNYKNELTQLANQAARFAAVDKDPADGTSPFPGCNGLKTYLSNPANTDTPEVANMIKNGTVHITTGSQVGDPVTIRLTASFSFLNFLGAKLGTPNTSLTGVATMRLEQPPTFSSASC